MSAFMRQLVGGLVFAGFLLAGCLLPVDEGPQNAGPALMDSGTPGGAAGGAGGGPSEGDGGPGDDGGGGAGADGGAGTDDRPLFYGLVQKHCGYNFHPAHMFLVAESFPQCPPLLNFDHKSNMFILLAEPLELRSYSGHFDGLVYAGNASAQHWAVTLDSVGRFFVDGHVDADFGTFAPPWHFRFRALVCPSWGPCQ